MNTNLYWPVYKNIESEVIILTYFIHFDDTQLNVYSSKISDLIVRAAIEIESLSKELYIINGGKQKRNIKFDYDALDFLNQKWKIEKKTIHLTSGSCFLSNKTITPFLKNDKSYSDKPTYSWNIAYQNLKHDRGKFLKSGSIKNLLEVLAALFILNLYYRDEKIYLNTRNSFSSFPFNMGSDFFSVELHKFSQFDAKGEYLKKENFQGCLYFERLVDQDRIRYIDDNKKKESKINELLLLEPKVMEYIEVNNLKKINRRELVKIAGRDVYLDILKYSSSELIQVFNELRYEAVLNKSQV